MTPSINEVCEQALQLPCAPMLLPRLLDVLGRTDRTIQEIKELIQIDPVLASSVLRLANSAYFSAGNARIGTLHDALLRLGQREVFRVAALSIAGRWLTHEVEGYCWEPGDFCRMSLVTAVAAEVLAERTGRVPSDVSYAAGLVCGVGKLAIAYSCGGHFETIREYQKMDGCTWLDAESAVLGFNFATVGARLLTQWKFPDAFVAVATYNPPNNRLPAEHLPLAVHVHAANYLSASIGVGQGEDGFLIALNSNLLLEWGFTVDVLEAALPEVLNRASLLLRQKLASGPIEF
ncbi:HDOD domain-containing protein [Termitidicoccus mucosus]|uniref:Histidine kinase n=1 Tax=Termitidicoccus mucosus TaxID=1184151 RepID=A0A178IHR5_9BACT|nr:histidine kinase [Opitutaceae bacterium TSB47]